MAGPNFKKVTHCIFDMDGLLIDSESVHEKIYRMILSNFGYEFGGRVAFEILGRTDRSIAQILVEHYNLPMTFEEFHEIDRQLQRELFNHVEMMPGAERLLKHLKEHNIPIALATSSCRYSYNVKTGHLQHIFKLFHHQVLGGSDPDVKKGKPNPDIFLVAASRFPDNPDPSQCLVFEDAPNGTLAGLSAGMQVVIVPDPNVPKDLINEKVSLQLNSLEKFKPELFGLPPFKN